jgi:hypothetical protein
MQDGAEVGLSFSFGYIPNRLWLGLLRAAYLGVFRTLGYSYALAPSATWIRRQIAEHDPPSPYLDRIVRMMEPPFRSLRRGFLGLDLSQHLGRPVYLALLQTKLKLTATYAVALPHAGASELGQPEALADALD